MPKTCPVRGRTDRCGAVDVIVSPSAALPDGRTGTGSRIGLVPDRRVIEGSPPDDAGADRSIRLGVFQESAVDQAQGCTRIAPSVGVARSHGGRLTPGSGRRNREAPRIGSIRGA